MIMAQATEQEYNSLKTQYDQLLEKHQNDSIRSRQKEQALQTQLTQLQTLIASLQPPLTETHLHPPNQLPSTRVGQLQSDVRRLMDQNILLTSLNTSLKTQCSCLQSTNAELKTEIEQMKTYIKSLEKDTAQLNQLNNKQMMSVFSQTEEKIITAQELHALKLKNEKLLQTVQQLRQKVNQLGQQAQRAKDRERKAIQLVKKKEAELSALESQISLLKIPHRDKKKTEVNETACIKCIEQQQEIQLLKQMVKSTQGMVRVKEIENQKFRMHSEEVISNQSRSGKQKEKGTPLPPLGKKK